MSIEILKQEYHFPDTKPNLEENYHNCIWFQECAKTALRNRINDDTKVIVELGSWLGMSTKFLAETAPNAVVIAIDHWAGSAEHFEHESTRAILPILYDQFIANCWDFKDKIIPFKTDTITGMKRLKELGIEPDLFYVDAAHDYESVKNDVLTILDLFPNAKVVGDDYDWSEVSRAVEENVVNGRGLKIGRDHVTWFIE